MRHGVVEIFWNEWIQLGVRLPSEAGKAKIKLGVLTQWNSILGVSGREGKIWFCFFWKDPDEPDQLHEGASWPSRRFFRYKHSQGTPSFVSRWGSKWSPACSALRAEHK